MLFKKLFSTKKKLLRLLLLSIIFLFTCYPPNGTLTIKPGVHILSGLNTQYNDYNLSGPPGFNFDNTFAFSTDASSDGAQFDVYKGNVDLSINSLQGFRLFSERLGPFMDAECNSSDNEYGPILLYSDEYSNVYDYNFDQWDTYLFASDRTTDLSDLTHDRNIYFYNTNTGLQLTGFNSLYEDAYPTYAKINSRLYFSSTRAGDSIWSIYSFLNSSANNDYSTWLDIQVSGSSIDLTTVINSSSNDQCPYINGDIMIFASDRVDGFGGYDLYYSKITNDVWSTPVNLGEPFNSSSDEFRPSIYYPVVYEIGVTKNKIIIFSSNRSGGKGGFDLYLGILDKDFL